MRTAGRLQGRVAVVTGGARGIGLQVARQLAAAGARVAILDVDGGEAVRAASSIGGRSEALGLPVDVRDRRSLAAAVDVVVEHFGGIDLVVANAGVAPDFSTFRTGDQTDFDRVVDVNLLGAVNTVRATLEQVVAREGRLILVCSVYAFSNGALQSSYAITKAGIEQFGRALRLELRPHGVGVTLAYFGFVDTALVANTWTQAAAEEYRQAIPRVLRTTITPQRAARAVIRAVRRDRQTVVVPRRWHFLMVFRGIYEPIAERVLARDRHYARALAGADAAGVHAAVHAPHSRPAEGRRRESSPGI